MLPMVIAGGGSFTSPKPTLHTTTNAEVIYQFTGRRFQFKELEGGRWSCNL
jgi:RNA 3'-terminal phosphate cyclase (ATP)